jgi:hypothetical protein
MVVVMRHCKRQYLLGIILILALFLVLGSSCTKTEPDQSVILKAQPLKTEFKISETLLEQSYVIRCSSYSETSDGLTLTTTKNKNAKIVRLVFVSLPNPGEMNSELIISDVPISENETVYNLAEAGYHRIDLTEGQNAISNYGISYLDWKTGSVSDSQKFPCCE